MTLERQDVRAKLDADVHEALLAICSAKGLTVGEFIENLLVPEVRRLVHEAHDIAGRTVKPGTSGKNREHSVQPGTSRR